MNPYRSSDLAKSYRADDIRAATDRRTAEATVDATASRVHADQRTVAHPSGIGLTVRRFILRSA